MPSASQGPEVEWASMQEQAQLPVLEMQVAGVGGGCRDGGVTSQHGGCALNVKLWKELAAMT